MTTVYDELLAEGDDEGLGRYVRVERKGDRAIVTLDDPERLNVLSAPMVRQLKRALEGLSVDRKIRSIVLTGEGRAFSAGGDLKMMAMSQDRITEGEGTTDVWRSIRNEFGGIVRLIARTDKAFIAALNGPGAGVGLAWALSCDIVIAGERAVIVPAFGKLGLLPEVGTSWVLTRALGYSGAVAYYVSGDHLSAEQALEAGLVQEVVPADDLLAAAERWCDRIGEMPPHAFEMTKPLLRAAADASWDGSLALEEFAEPNCFTTAAFQGTVRGMLER